MVLNRAHEKCLATHPTRDSGKESVHFRTHPCIQKAGDAVLGGEHEVQVDGGQ